MKQLLCLGLLGFYLSVLGAQTVDVPKAVQQTFSKMFPAVSSVSWDQTGEEYTANFIENDYFASATFRKDGKWSKTETLIA